MKEQLVSFRTAKLANKNGFDWKCNTTYTESGKEILFWFPHDDFYGYCDIRTAIESFPLSDQELLAPTQSFLQKWLREKHNLYVIIELAVEYYYKIYNSELGNEASLKKEAIWGNDDKPTYEEALEAGLYEALLLIKNK